MSLNLRRMTNLRRLTRFGAIVALILVGAFVVVPAQPAAADPPISPVKFLLRYNSKCLEADLNNINTNGDAAQLWDCWNDPGNQQWRPEPIAPTLYNPAPGERLVNVLTGQCLDADLGTVNQNGGRLQLWNCWNDPGNERWLVS